MHDEIRRINELGLWDFELARRDGDRLLLLGSNDFVYGHYLEAEFGGVAFCDLPDAFSHAEFRIGRDGSIWVYLPDDDRECEIQAVSLQIRVGRVSYTRK